MLRMELESRGALRIHVTRKDLTISGLGAEEEAVRQIKLVTRKDWTTSGLGAEEEAVKTVGHLNPQERNPTRKGRRRKRTLTNDPNLISPDLIWKT